MIRLVVLPFVIVSAPVGSDFVQQVDYQTDSLTPLNITPTFDNGYLVVYGGRGASVYSQDGSLAYTISNPESGSIPNLAVDKDRTAAAAVHYSLPGGMAGAISAFDRAGTQVRLIHTGRYLHLSSAWGLIIPSGQRGSRSVIAWTTGLSSSSCAIFRRRKRIGRIPPALVLRS